MIAQLTGTVVSAGATSFVIDVQGVGYLAHTNATTSATLRPGETTTVYTSVILRQDSLTLWGFGTAGERDAFELVQTASGVGPKVAAAILSVFSPAELSAVITAEDARRLTTVPGIGAKGAAKIILELKDKIRILGVDQSEQPRPATTDGAWRPQLVEGLEGLGWSAREADGACDSVAHLVEDDPTIPVAKLMRAALRTLAKR